MLNLVSSSNEDGYLSALFKTWKHDDGPVPHKSSLSEFRSKVSYKFFEDIYRAQLVECKSQRKRFRGFYIYAADGDQFDLPASARLISEGFRGHPLRGNKETHGLKMYTSQVFDVINNLVVDVRTSNRCDEVHMSRDMVQGLEPNSITLYDRLYCGYWTFFAHMEANNNFIVRARTKGGSVNLHVRQFCQSTKRSEQMIWYPLNSRKEYPGIPVRLVKVKNKRTGEDLVFVTNLTKDLFSDVEIAKLYQKRWMIESSFKDLTNTMKLKIGRAHV